MDFVYIGVFLCAIAFAIVCLYMAKVLLRVSSTLTSLGNTLGEVETKMRYITSELENTIKETDKTMDDVEHKLRATDSLFDTLENVGSSITNFNEVVHHQSKKIADNRELRKVEPVAHSIQWSEVAFRLLQKWKNNQRKEGEV